MKVFFTKKIACKIHQIQIGYFSRHFYVVNFRLLAMDHFKPDFVFKIFSRNLMTNIFKKCLADLSKTIFWVGDQPTQQFFLH